jgi:hypothetical protein
MISLQIQIFFDAEQVAGRCFNPVPATQRMPRFPGLFSWVGRFSLGIIVPMSFQFVLELGVARRVGTIEHAPESQACGASRLTAGTGAHSCEHRLNDLFELAQRVLG